MSVRIEEDCIGKINVPKESYYGINSLRGKENFSISEQTVHPVLIECLAKIKQAAAKTNWQAGELSAEKTQAIQQACMDIIAGNLSDQFILDAIQGGAGTSTNMNINEVIANRAIEFLGEEKGDYSVIHPNDDVNKAQSTNDVYPTAGKLTTIYLMCTLKKELRYLKRAFNEKSIKFQHIQKIGRTQLQDAVPMTLGDTFLSYVSLISRLERNLDRMSEELKEVNLGGTAIGDGVNASSYYASHIVEELNSITGIQFRQADNLFDSTQNLDVFTRVSGELKSCALSISKICNDLRLLSSGPRTGISEIHLPELQNGSSIMPGKINPVIPEVFTQIAYKVAGNDVTISMAVEAGQLELNAFEPVIFQSMFESIEWLTNGLKTLRVNCVEGITANSDHCQGLLENSLALATLLSPVIGYQKAATVAKEAHKYGKTVKEVVLQKGWMTSAEINQFLNREKSSQSILTKATGI